MKAYSKDTLNYNSGLSLDKDKHMKIHQIRDEEGNVKYEVAGPSDTVVAELLLLMERIDDIDDAPELVMSSDTFIREWKKHIDTLAKFKKFNDEKIQLRPLGYNSIGVLDLNDVYQETYMAFIEAFSAWDNIDDPYKSGDITDEAKAKRKWTYIKKTTLLNMERSLRGSRFVVRIPEHVGAVDNPTTLFGRIDKVFGEKADEDANAGWWNDFLGSKLEDIIGDTLDKPFHQQLIKAFFGIDEAQMSYKELSETFRMPESTVRKVKQRVLAKLQTPEVMMEIAEFMREYKIETDSAATEYGI